MPRPFCIKSIRNASKVDVFKPNGIPYHELQEVTMSLDELEALRLADLQGLYQEAAARKMGISRQTFGRIIEAARKKTADVLINGKALRISGGHVHLKPQGEEKMMIAIPTKQDQIDDHFGHCDQYSLYTLANQQIQTVEYVNSLEGCGCKSNMASLLAQKGVQLMIAGGIGQGAIQVLASQGIKTIRGAQGSALGAVEKYLKGELADSGETCQAHEQGCDHHGDQHSLRF